MESRMALPRITFNRPQARNAFTFRMYEQLGEICEQAEKDSSIKVLLLTGAGEKAFAAGTDISEFRVFSTAQDALDYESRIERVLCALENSAFRPSRRFVECAPAAGSRLPVAATCA